MDKLLIRLGDLVLLWPPVKEKDNSEFKPVKPRLKIDLVSHPVRAEGQVNQIVDILIIFKVE